METVLYRLVSVTERERERKERSNLRISKMRWSQVGSWGKEQGARSKEQGARSKGARSKVGGKRRRREEEERKGKEEAKEQGSMGARKEVAPRHGNALAPRPRHTPPQCLGMP